MTTPYNNNALRSIAELPPLLEGKRIFWIAMSASAVEVTPIAKFQATNDPSRPLNTLTPAQRAQEWVRICKKVSEAAGKRAVKQAEDSAITSPASLETVREPDALALSDSRPQRQLASSNAEKPIAQLRAELAELIEIDSLLVNDKDTIAASKSLRQWKKRVTTIINRRDLYDIQADPNHTTEYNKLRNIIRKCRKFVETLLETPE